MPDPDIRTPDTVESKIAYKGYFEIREDILELPEHSKRMFNVLLTSPIASVVLAETEAGDFILNREFRHPTDSWLYGCPGGSIDPGETPLEAAERELLEETGYTAESFHIMGVAHPFPSACTQKIYYVLAKNAKQIQPTNHEPFELIQVEKTSPQRLQEILKKGEFIDGILCTALCFRDVFYKS